MLCSFTTALRGAKLSKLVRLLCGPTVFPLVVSETKASSARFVFFVGLFLLLFFAVAPQLKKLASCIRHHYMILFSKTPFRLNVVAARCGFYKMALSLWAIQQKERVTGRHTYCGIQVSLQVIERDRHAPECHTWAPIGQRRTEVGRTQPYGAQAFTMEINHQPGLAKSPQCPAHTLTCVCKVQTVLCGNLPPVGTPCASEQNMCGTNPPGDVRFVLYACTCLCTVDRTAGSRGRSAIVNRNTDLCACFFFFRAKRPCSLVELSAGSATKKKKAGSCFHTSHVIDIPVTCCSALWLFFIFYFLVCTQCAPL